MGRPLFDLSDFFMTNSIFEGRDCNKIWGQNEAFFSTSQMRFRFFHVIFWDLGERDLPWFSNCSPFRGIYWTDKTLGEALMQIYWCNVLIMFDPRISFYFSHIKINSCFLSFFLSLRKSKFIIFQLAKHLTHVFRSFLELAKNRINVFWVFFKLAKNWIHPFWVF